MKDLHHFADSQTPVMFFDAATLNQRHLSVAGEEV